MGVEPVSRPPSGRRAAAPRRPGTLRLPEIENIDANKANTTFIGHSYFVDGSLVLRDLEDILQRDYSPELRVLCPDNKMPEEYAYWKMIDDKTQCQSAATSATPASPPAPRSSKHVVDYSSVTQPSDALFTFLMYL